MSNDILLETRSSERLGWGRGPLIHCCTPWRPVPGTRQALHRYCWNGKEISTSTSHRDIPEKNVQGGTAPSYLRVSASWMALGLILLEDDGSLSLASSPPSCHPIRVAECILSSPSQARLLRSPSEGQDDVLTSQQGVCRPVMSLRLPFLPGPASCAGQCVGAGRLPPVTFVPSSLLFPVDGIESAGLLEHGSFHTLILCSSRWRLTLNYPCLACSHRCLIVCLDFQLWFSCSLVLLLGELPRVTSPLQALSSAWLGGRPCILCQMAGTRLQLAFVMAVIWVPGENRVSSFRSLFSFRVFFSFFCPIYKKQCVLTWITGALRKPGEVTSSQVGITVHMWCPSCQV